MDIFIKALLEGRITDDDIGDFVSIASTWRATPEWLDISRFEGDKLRFYAKGNFIEVSGSRPTRNGGNWTAIHGEFETS